MALSGSTLTLFDSHFVIEQPGWAQVVHLLKKQYDSVTEKEKVSEGLNTLHIEDFRKEDANEKEAPEKLLECIATLYPPSLPTDRDDMM